MRIIFTVAAQLPRMRSGITFRTEHLPVGGITAVSTITPTYAPTVLICDFTSIVKR